MSQKVSLIFQFAKSIFGRKTAKDSLVTLAATLVSTAFSTLFFILLARSLGPARYGLFFIALTVVMTVCALMDVGTTQGLLRFLPKARAERKEADLLAYVKLGLITKVIFGVIGTLAIFVLAGFLGNSVFHKPGLDNLLAIFSVGVLAGLVFAFGSTIVQALQRFYAWGFLQIAWGVFRVVLIILLIFLGLANPASALTVYATVLIGVFFVSFTFMPKGFLKAKITPDHFHKFFSYNRWAAFYMLVVSVLANLDKLFLGKFSSLTDTGYYVAAAQAAAVGTQAYAALGTVLIPKFAALSTKAEIVSLLKKTLALCWVLALLGLMVIPFSSLLISIFFGLKYLPAAVPLKILITSMACVLVSLPFTTIWMYTMGHSKSFSLYYFLNGVLCFMGYWLLVPPLGAIGAATVSLLGNVLTLGISAIYVSRHLARLSENV